jgi:hypothetical protein
MEELAKTNPSSNDTDGTDNEEVVEMILKSILFIRVHPCHPWLVIHFQPSVPFASVSGLHVRPSSLRLIVV